MSNVDDIYGLGHSIKSFAVDNEFVERMNTGCYQLGTSLQPFCFFANELQKQWGVLDIANFTGFYNTELNLAKDIAYYRRELYTSDNFGILSCTDEVNKTLFYDYLLSVSLCYVEIPKWTTKNGVSQKSFDKYLATRNPAVMASWMGFSVNEMQAKYSSRIQQSNIDFLGGELKVVKLLSTAKGNTITVPRGTLKTAEMTCIPVFMLYAMLNGVWSKMQNSIVNFTYLKDNEVVRELPSTINFDILLDYYKDMNFISGMLQGVDVFSEDQGGLMLSSKQSRGYVKIPELGCSKYDYSGVRSLNISRILRMEIVDKVDRSFINVDLNIVVDEFKGYLSKALVSHPDRVIQIYNLLQLNKDDTDDSDQSLTIIADRIISYIDTSNAVLTTSFKRSLHRFMVLHPELFDNYTGIPMDNVRSTVAKSYGIDAGF